MSILLLSPPLLLLLAALVAPATSATTYRPDWNRLRGLARGRVEVSAPFPNLSTTVPQPCCPSSWNTVRSGLRYARIPESPPFPPAWPGNHPFYFPAAGCPASTVGVRSLVLAAWHSEPFALLQAWPYHGSLDTQSLLFQAIIFLKLALKTPLLSSPWITPLFPVIPPPTPT